MSTENLEKIRKYKEDLEKYLKELKEERKELVEKINNAEMISRKELKRNQDIAEEIKLVQERLTKFKAVKSFETMSDSLNKIGDTTTSKTEKSKLIKSLLKDFEEFNKNTKKDLLDSTEFTEEEIKDIDKLKKDIEIDLKGLADERKELIEKINNGEILSKTEMKRNKEISEEKEELEEKLELIKKLGLLDLTKVKEDLEKLADDKTDKKTKDTIIKKYNNIIESNKEKYLEELLALANEELEYLEDEVLEEEKEDNKDKNKKSLKVRFNDLKKRTKEKLKDVSESFDKNKGKIKKVGATILLCVVIIVVAKSCAKKIENDRNNSDNKTNIENTYNNVDKKLVKDLTDKGYSEYAATLMAENFSEETLDALKNIPYIEAVENYANEANFNIDYINDYENARAIYNIPADKAVDYVNRSAEIQKTGFYNDATINEIVEIVMAIDNKELFTQNNANLAQSFNTSFNRIVDNYLFGSTTEEDIKKIDALNYFAADGTDMDLFLTEFATIAKDNIENPNNKEAKDKMYNYIATFALSLNGYTNVDEDIKVDTPYNTNAQVNDYYDWYIAYNSFIAPLYPTFVNEEEFSKYEELQNIMIKAMQDPQFEIICGENRTLGGK